MCVKFFPLLVVVFVCAISAAGQSVIESESSVLINESSANVTLMIDSRAARRAPTTIDLALLDPDGNSRASVSHRLRLYAGKRKYKVGLPLGDVMKQAGDQIAWWRMRYRVGDSAGIVSLSELLRDDFDLRAAAFQRVIPGSPVRVRVRSLNPYTDAAVKNVNIKAELTIGIDTESDDDELKLSGTARTNGDGFAFIDFRIPENLKWDGEAELVLTGRKNGIVRKIEEDFDDEDEPEGSVLLTADKPLYQPGQAFNVRALYFDANNTVVPKSELEFKIEDEDGTTVYRQTVATSDFGIAAISWAIPDNAKLGTYRVAVEADDDLSEYELAFKVSRYDLPNFTVTATPDKNYYLPSDAEAWITVNADYLFGKPVTQGKVRVVQENERTWNYREQRYDVEEGASFEGQADASGKFIAKFDLKTEIANLLESEWRRYKDINFSAYYTDLTTNRTEQRRFDIRLTKEPIHIYLMRYGDQHRELPLTAYVSTFYADGTPAACGIEIRDKSGAVSQFKTNSIGAGKFEVRIPQENLSGSEYEIRITARDRSGRQGTFEESFYLGSDEAIQIRTNQAIYKPGDMIEVELFSSRQEGFVYVDVVKNWTPVDSHVVELHKGKGSLSIPYKPSFRGDMVIAAYSDKEEGRWSYSMRAARGVIFPEQQNLLVNAKFSKDEYRPGEDAAVRFSVTDGGRKPFESAIGLGIFDKAIEERARTDAEFGGYFSRFYRLMGYDRSFGSITLKDLNALDLSRPVSPEMQLAAEIMLAGGWYYPRVYHSGNHDTEAKTLYYERIRNQLKPVEAALKEQFKKDYGYASDQASLRRILAANGIEFSGLRDPWGQEYIPAFNVNRTQIIVSLKTAGADKKPGTADDFDVFSAGFPYFTKVGEALDRAALQYRERTGKYIRDLQTLQSELAKQGIDIAGLKDGWGRDYRITFEVAGRYYVISFYSYGPNGNYEPENWRGDDFDVWKSHIDYFSETEREINRILSEEVNVRKKPFPRREAEFAEMLRRHKLDIASITDGYGNPVYVTSGKEPRYIDKTKIENGKTTITPVTEEMLFFKIRSGGSDRYSAKDDTDLATFSGAITAAHKGTGFATTDVKPVVFNGAKGAIGGTVTDPNGAVVANAEVTATAENDESQKYTTHTDEEGKFLLGNMPSGRYSLRTSSPGFQTYVRTNIQVRSQSLVEINITLEVAGVSSVVAVTAEADATVNGTSLSVAKTVTEIKPARITFPHDEQTSTPRLREYFPETLVWRPEIVTDKKGRAEVSFKMADNITTWKMFAIASTRKGKVGVVEKEITAFQSFFVDLDPPKFLTAGDEIHLPTQVRNYTEKDLKVDVTMDKADWFTLLGDSKQRIDVATNASRNAVFGFKAVTPVTAGKQRVIALARSDSDAIEKPVTVRPDGEEIVRTESRVFNGSARFDINYPAETLPNTQKAELKIYPNLFSHVAESVEGLLARPYGCGEQTISSTYPNLMILKFVKTDSPLRQRAQKYLQKGYERLLGYQTADGGFTYWGSRDNPDIALTAYALRFLNDAKGFVEVDDSVIKRAEDWLIRQQNADGSWTKRYSWENSDNSARTKLMTTYVVRSLAMLHARTEPTKAGGAGSASTPRGKAIAAGLDYLRKRNAEIDEPYALALFGLASLDAGDAATAKQIAARLVTMAIPERQGVYWKLETNTPFYGWGTAGRIETTALVVQLLTRTAKLDPKMANSETAAKGLVFLLRNKDRYGVWYSTQTTINVLDAFLSILSSDGPPQAQALRIAINGTELPEILVSADQIEPVILDLTGKISPAGNSVEVRSPGSSSLMAQTISTHYIDWRDSQAPNADVGPSRALKLDYKCDKPNPAIMEEVTCSVGAERVGFQGYGMLLAEIGTPPGADVSRESLEAALESDWSLRRYEILPDRVILYMWSKPGGTKFSFKFKPRYGINAQTPASVVYDYYNPEAMATVTPLRFTVK